MSLNPVWQSIGAVIFYLVLAILIWNIRESSRELIEDVDSKNRLHNNLGGN
jgi:hypothetical protein